MNRHELSVIFVLVVTTCLLSVVHASDPAGELQQQLAAGDTKGTEQLIDRLAVPGHGDDTEARELLHGVAIRVTRPAAEQQRSLLCATICQAVASDRPSPVKRFLVRQLQIAGGDESVPTLAGALRDELLAEDARQALLAIPGLTSTNALREALPESQGAMRVGLINALGQRRDGQAVPLLMDEAGSGNEAIRIAAIEALGRIGAPQAEAVIASAIKDGPPDVRLAALRALLELAGQIADGGPYGDVATKQPKLRQKAFEMYATVLKHAPNPALKCAAIEGLADVGDGRAVELIMPCATDNDLSVRETATRWLSALPGEEVSTAIRGAFEKADPLARMRWLDVLARRKDAGAAAAVEAATGDASPQVRVTAWHLLGRLEEPAVDMEASLLEAARDGAAPTRGIALAAYTRLAEVCLAQGKQDRAISILRQTVELDPPADVRDAAIRQLWQLGSDFDPARQAGYITSWWLCGPIRGNDLDTPWPPEQDVKLDEPVTCGQDLHRWKHHRTTDPQGVVDLASLMKPNENTTAYLYSEIGMTQARDVTFKIGSNDGMKLWLNGRLIHTHPHSRSLTVDEDTVETRLEAGANRFLFKVVQGSGGWAACLRILDEDGKPVGFKQELQR